MYYYSYFQMTNIKIILASSCMSYFPIHINDYFINYSRHFPFKLASRQRLI